MDTRLTWQLGEAAWHTASTSATSAVMLDVEEFESVSDHVCLTSAATLPATRPCKLAAISSAVTLCVVGSSTAMVMANDCGENGGGE